MAHRIPPAKMKPLPVSLEPRTLTLYI